VDGAGRLTHEYTSSAQSSTDRHKMRHRLCFASSHSPLPASAHTWPRASDVAFDFRSGSDARKAKTLRVVLWEHERFQTDVAHPYRLVPRETPCAPRCSVGLRRPQTNASGTSHQDSTAMGGCSHVSSCRAAGVIGACVGVRSIEGFWNSAKGSSRLMTNSLWWRQYCSMSSVHISTCLCRVSATGCSLHTAARPRLRLQGAKHAEIPWPTQLRVLGRCVLLSGSGWRGGERVVVDAVTHVKYGG
jgi:hypothetical protein